MRREIRRKNQKRIELLISIFLGFLYALSHTYVLRRGVNLYKHPRVCPRVPLLESSGDNQSLSEVEKRGERHRRWK